jgi:hypothetical protein
MPRNGQRAIGPPKLRKLMDGVPERDRIPSRLPAKCERRRCGQADPRPAPRATRKTVARATASGPWAETDGAWRVWRVAIPPEHAGRALAVRARDAGSGPGHCLVLV